MNRAQEIENIIIGTLLCSTEEENYFDSCRNCVTDDMFMDSVNRSIFRMVSEMNSKGMRRVNPLTLLNTFGARCSDICYRMCELSVNYSFLHRKTQYNERQFLLWAGYGMKPQYTDVSFDDYVTCFLNNAYETSKKCG